MPEIGVGTKGLSISGPVEQPHNDDCECHECEEKEE